MRTIEFVVTKRHVVECEEGITDKVLTIGLNPVSPDKSFRYLKRDTDYIVKGNIIKFIYPEINEGDEIWIQPLNGRVLTDEEYRVLLCDPKTWYGKSFGLYAAADAIIKLLYRDISSRSKGIAPRVEPMFGFCMLDSWLLLMSFAVENAAKGIIVYNEIKKQPSLKKTATIESFNIKGHYIGMYVRRVFKAKNKNLEFMEAKSSEDLEAYASFAGKYRIGLSQSDVVPHNIIMNSTTVECLESGYFDAIVLLYKKLEGWLIEDLDEYHKDEITQIHNLEDECSQLFK